jgi:3-polyprenyl-4-hydroxybenzoate decarboxylase
MRAEGSMSAIETNHARAHIACMATETHKQKKTGAARAQGSFVYRGVKITPMGTGNSRIARAVRKGLERRERERQVVTHGAPA